jgi:rhodanese-related sulfurtransferase
MRKQSDRQVGHTEHRDKRVNIPTEELRDFVEQDEQTPKMVRFASLASTACRGGAEAGLSSVNMQEET